MNRNTWLVYISMLESSSIYLEPTSILNVNIEQFAKGQDAKQITRGLIHMRLKAQGEAHTS